MLLLTIFELLYVVLNLFLVGLLSDCVPVHHVCADTAVRCNTVSQVGTIITPHTRAQHCMKGPWSAIFILFRVHDHFHSIDMIFVFHIVYMIISNSNYKWLGRAIYHQNI